MFDNVIQIRRNRTLGTETVYRSFSSRGLKVFNWKISPKMHEVFTQLTYIRPEKKTNLITEACHQFYGTGYDFELYGQPSLVAPTSNRGICTSWASPIELNLEMKRIAEELNCTMQQLVDHAVWKWHNLPAPER